MKVGVLSNVFQSNDNKAVEDDLVLVAETVMKVLKSYGHEVEFFDVNETTFEKLRNSDIDIAFNVCERFNGNSLLEPHVAAMLELLNIPYTGAGPLSLALCMNKVRVKEIMLANNIPTPKYQVFYSKNKKLNSELKFPLFVKPACMDNSIGILNDAICHDEKQLKSKVASLLKLYNQPVLVEEFIEGREIHVGVLGNGNNARTLPISEYVFNNATDLEGMNPILCYDAKWNPQTSVLPEDCEICPAPLPKYLESRVSRIALELHRLLETKDYSRIDIRLSKEGVPYVLEMNPNPGISADNTLPTAAQSLGLTHDEMIYEIFTQALIRYRIKDRKKFSKKNLIIQQ